MCLYNIKYIIRPLQPFIAGVALSHRTMSSPVPNSKLKSDKSRNANDDGDIWSEVENFLKTPAPNLSMYQRRPEFEKKQVKTLPLLPQRRPDACESVSIDSLLLQEAFDCAKNLQHCTNDKSERQQLYPIAPKQGGMMVAKVEKPLSSSHQSNWRTMSACYQTPIPPRKSQVISPKLTQSRLNMKGVVSSRSVEVMADDLSRGVVSEQLYKELRASQEKFAISNEFLMQAQRSFFAQSNVVD